MGQLWMQISGESGSVFNANQQPHLMHLRYDLTSYVWDQYTFAEVKYVARRTQKIAESSSQKFNIS